MKLLFYSLTLAILISSCSDKGSQNINLEIKGVTFSYSELEGLEPENGICRRDPSDVIKVDGIYYLWYTKTDNSYSGYYNASIWYAISKDGKTWEEKGEVIDLGESGSWDAFSIFTPNILKASDKYYLYYTAVKPTPTPGNPQWKFENNSETDITAIGLTVSDSPNGPFVRVSTNPILEVSDNSDDFDSYRVDDACIVYRNNTYFMYYKGRSRKYGKDGPSHTKLGVSTSKKPEGPYKKYENNPIITSGHEVMVWPYQNGIMTLLSEHGLEGKTLQFASDGINFKKITSFGNDYPKAPGSYRIGNFTDTEKQEEGISWGISMFYGSKEKWPHLLRYEIKLEE